jgi:hypothetical protein
VSCEQWRNLIFFFIFVSFGFVLTRVISRLTF